MKQEHANALKALEACRAATDFDMEHLDFCVFGQSRKALGIHPDGWQLGKTYQAVSNAMGFGDCYRSDDPFRKLVESYGLTQQEACDQFAILINRTHRRSLGV